MFLLISISCLSILCVAVSIHLMFLLIQSCFRTASFLIHVSIHLMFLLIIKKGKKNMKILSFNTSHVSINQWKGVTLFLSGYRFNTSHVSINPCVDRVIFYITYVSIHLMFLLIQGHLALSLFPLYHKHQEMSLFYRFFTR